MHFLKVSKTYTLNVNCKSCNVNAICQRKDADLFSHMWKNVLKCVFASNSSKTKTGVCLTCDKELPYTDYSSINSRTSINTLKCAPLLTKTSYIKIGVCFCPCRLSQSGALVASLRIRVTSCMPPLGTVQQRGSVFVLNQYLEIIKKNVNGFFSCFKMMFTELQTIL